MNTKAATTSYVQETRSLLSSSGPLAWLTTLDHKRLGVMYLVASLLALLAATVLGVGLRRDVGASAVFGLLFLVPSLTATLGNFVLPLQLGQKEAALPRVSLAGFWLYVLAAGLVVAGLVASEGKTGPAGLLPIGGVLVLGLSVTLNALNLLATTARAAFGGAPASRVTLFAWGLCATSIAELLGFVAVGGLLALVPVAHLGFVSQDFAARVLARPWTELAPSGTLLLVPAVGVVGDVLAAFAGRKRLAGYGVAATSLTILAWVGLVEWIFPILGDSGSPVKAGFATTVVAGALGVLLLCYVATLYRGRIAVEAPLLWALGCLFQLTLGVPAALLLGVPPTSVYFQGTLFEGGYRHGILAGAAGMGFVAGVFYFWPKITGRLPNERLAGLGFALVFVGLQLAFLSDSVRGLSPESLWLESASLYGSWVLAVGGVATVAALVASLRSGTPSNANPWGAAGLEWEAASPPPLENLTHDPGVDARQSRGESQRLAEPKIATQDRTRAEG